MKKINFYLLSALALLANASLQAQVTIGGNTEAAVGAILDLNSSSGVKGGLLLSNVSITNLNKIPAGTNQFPGITAGVNDGRNPDFKGAIVYNTNPATGVGVYVWTGTQWIPACTNILYDAEGNDYTIGNFGAAGWWMTQNLRTTAGLTPTTDYSYPTLGYGIPTTMAFEDHPEYGLLYIWAAANGVESTNEEPNPKNRQGVCPTGWHIPNDIEWTDLVNVISASVGKEYSTVGDVNVPGTKMKSATKVEGVSDETNGKSRSREDNGFDALLVGGVYSGQTEDYGLRAWFLSSSASSRTGEWDRGVHRDDALVVRGSGMKLALFSVRCKKN
jgi:uncharacterized protein (TIGR02145 family)